MAFAAEIGALEAVVEVGNVVPDVAADLGIEEVDTLSSLENISAINPIEETPIDNPPNVGEAPAESSNVEPPQTNEAPPNVDQPSGEPTPEPSKHDSGIDLSQDEQDFLGKLDESTFSEAPKEMAPQDTITVFRLDTPEVPDPVFSTDPATGDVTLTVHGTDGTITETVIDTAGESTVTVTSETGGVTVTNTVTEVDENGITTTVTKADDVGNVTETTTFPHGNTKVKEVDAATGDTVITDTFTDPQTGDQVVIKSVTDAQGNIRTIKTETTLDTNTAGDTTVTEVTTETETDANGNVIEETVTTKKTDPNGNTTVIVHNSPDVSTGSPTPTPPSLSPTPDSPAPPPLDTPTPESPQAGPSQPTKRPFPGDSSSEGEPPTKKGKEKA